MLEVRVLDGAGVRAHVEDVRRIHGACFPEDVDDEDAEGAGGHPDDAFWDRLTACHDADDVLWFLLVDAGDARAEVSAADARRNANDRDARPGTAEGGVENGIENQTATGRETETADKKVARRARRARRRARGGGEEVFFSTSKTSRFFGRAGGRAGRARGAATVTVVGDLRRARTRERGERETS